MAGANVFWLANVSFLLAGMAQTLLAFENDELGFAKDSANFINAVGNPLGQLLFVAFYWKLWLNWDRNLFMCAVPIVACELGYNFFSQVSIQKAGSGMYQLIHAFVVVLNAFLGHALLGKKLKWPRWCAIAAICCGVALSSLAQLQLKGVDVGAQAFGIGAGFAANLMVAGVYVAANVLLEEPWERPVPKPLVLAQMLGVMEVTIIAIYFCAHVLPNWDTMVSAHMPAGTSAWQCASSYVAYIFVCGVHQFAFYYTCSLGPTGAVTAGINKCVQTAGLFFLSSALFCNVAASQCLSPLKVVSAFAVCAAVLAYGWLSARESAARGLSGPEGGEQSMVEAS